MTTFRDETYAAKKVHKANRTMQRHRQEGTGPRYYRVGGRILYTDEDLEAWVLANARMSTSETGSAS